MDQTDTSLLGIRILVGPAPAFFFILGLIALLLFPLNKKRYQEIAKNHKEMRARTGIDYK